MKVMLTWPETGGPSKNIGQGMFMVNSMPYTVTWGAKETRFGFLLLLVLLLVVLFLDCRCWLWLH